MSYLSNVHQDFFNNNIFLIKMVARIYKPSKTAMQSGMAQTKKWVLELEYDMAKSIEPLMGWTGSSDTNSQVQLWFESKEVAINYAKKNEIPFTVLSANSRKHIIRENGYGDNFSFNKKIPWTH